METHVSSVGRSEAPRNHRLSASRILKGAICAATIATITACGGEHGLAPDAVPSPALGAAGPTAGTNLPALARMQVPDNFPFKRFLCFGDSLTLGVTQRSGSYAGGMGVLTSVEGYPPKLGRLMEEAYGEGITLVNVGIGGENTREGLDRIDTEIRLHNPDIVLIIEGVVDINNEFPRFPIVRESLAEMMRLVQLRRRALVVGTVPRLNPDGFRIGGITQVPRLNDVIRQEAKAKNAPIADHEREFPNDYSGIGPDGLHPNEKGYRIMAETWFEQIQLMLSEIGFEPGG